MQRVPSAGNRPGAGKGAGAKSRVVIPLLLIGQKHIMLNLIGYSTLQSYKAQVTQNQNKNMITFDN